MKLLLDSHTAYWWVVGDDRLSICAEELIFDSANIVLVSAISIYEIELKIKYKRNQINLRPQELMETLKKNDVKELAVTHRHAELAARHDWSHRDPWDRLLAAQDILEECIFVSTDEEFDNIIPNRRW